MTAIWVGMLTIIASTGLVLTSAIIQSLELPYLVSAQRLLNLGVYLFWLPGIVVGVALIALGGIWAVVRKLREPSSDA
jgi:hypothetical protein